MKLRLGAVFTWAVDPAHILQGLSKGLQRKMLRIALNKASAPVKEKIVAAAPKRYGFLRKSIRIRLVNYREKTVWVSVIGAARSFVRKKGKRKRGRRKNEPIIHRPANYSFLIDQGTRHIRARHFIQRSFGRAFRRTFIRSLYAQIDSLLPKRRK
ncbi:HK97 gp10 family phage protein [Gemmata massiliana]|uniref:HK97 gp10 family phage protein n=1 Tax=Gemmata massiliana TaxID=1210884 RepID=UPI0013A6B1D0|nr:HK97 gp10 family phage protein [Gemmata massiliana]